MRNIVVLLLLSGITTISTQWAHSADVTLQQIHAAWRKRQDKVKTAHFKWIETRIIPKGKYGQNGPEFYPPQDTSHDFESELWISGNMIRYHWKGIQWREEVKQFIEKEYSSASDGKASRTLYSNHIDNRSGQWYPLGFIEKQHQHEDVGNPHAELPIFAVRPVAPGIGCEGLLMRTHSATAPPAVSMTSLDGSPQGYIHQQYGEHAREVWVDPSKDFSVTRYVVHLHGRRYYQISASYRQNKEIGWVPETWRVDRWVPGSAPNGVPITGIGGTAKMTSFEINPTIAAEFFRREFPIGTIVVDDRNGRKEYLVKEGGVARPVLDAENTRMATYEELMATEPGKAGLYRSASNGMWWWWIGGICALLVVCMSWRRWASRRPR